MQSWEDIMASAGLLDPSLAPQPKIRPTGGVDFGSPTIQDEASALDIAKRAAATGLGAFQSVMDTLGGRAIKGVLAGKPRELLSVLPFSDTLHITDPTQRTSGRDLLEHWGAVEHAEPGSGLDVGDVAGFGADLLPDPASYLFGPGAALTRGGQIAKAANILPGLSGRVGTTLRTAAGQAGQGQALADAVLAGTASALPGSKLAYLSNAATKAGVNLADLADKPIAGIAGFGLPFAR